MGAGARDGDAGRAGFPWLRTRIGQFLMGCARVRFLLALPLLLAACGALAGLAAAPSVPDNLAVTTDSFFGSYVFVWLFEALETAIWVFFNLATPVS